MRLATAILLAAALMSPVADAGARAQRAEPFVPAGVWYPARPGRTPGPLRDALQDRAVWQRDLAAIKAAGFNSISTTLEWARVEAERGQYRFDPVAGLLSVAGESGLKVVVQVETASAPPWLQRRYADAAVVPEPGRRTAPGAGYCVDHPGVRADLGAFIEAAAAAAARYEAFYAIDVWRNPGASPNGSARFCYCPYTQARFRDALQRKYRSIAALNAAWGRSYSRWADVHAPANPDRAGPDVTDWKQFFAVKLQEDLKFRADASSPRGARPVTSHAEALRPSGADEWLMARVVDHYGTAMPPVPAGETARPARLMAALDLMRSAARDTAWWLAALTPGAGAQADARRTNGPRDADLRLSTWAAISRGAGTIAYEDWPGLSSGLPAVGSNRLHGAGEAAGVIGRNSALFGPLRPHASRIALLLDPVLDGTLHAEAAVAYATLFNLNIQADFIHPDEVAAGLSSRYDVVYAAGASALTDAATGALRAFVLNGGVVVADHRRASPGVSGRSVRRVDDLFAAGVSPRQGTGAGGPDTASSMLRPSARGAFPVRVTNYGTGRVFLILPSQAAARPRGTKPQESEDPTLERVFSAAGLKPEVAIEGAGGLVDARFLESADAMLLVAINYGSSPRRVTFTFAPDVPEAIWQNMETGAAVNFVQGTDGPTYAHTFGGQDVIVLVRGKRLR